MVGQWEELSFQQLIDELPDLVCRYAPDGALLYVNHAYARFHDASPEDMVGHSFLDFVDVSVRPGIAAALNAMRHTRPDDPVRHNTHRTLSVTGNTRWHEWTDRAFFDDSGELLGFMSIGRDCTDMLTLARTAEHDLVHDHLTQILNRRGVFAMLGDRLVQFSDPFLVGFIDIDDFKQINDQYGHREGDRVLVRIAAVLGDLTPDVIAGRIGGDEFVVVIPSADVAAEGPTLAANLNRTLEALDLPVTASCGWAVTRPGDTADDVLHAADHDMYRRRSSNGQADATEKHNTVHQEAAEY